MKGLRYQKVWKPLYKDCKVYVFEWKLCFSCSLKNCFTDYKNEFFLQSGKMFLQSHSKFQAKLRQVRAREIVTFPITAWRQSRICFTWRSTKRRICAPEKRPSWNVLCRWHNFVKVLPKIGSFQNRYPNLTKINLLIYYNNTLG